MIYADDYTSTFIIELLLLLLLPPCDGVECLCLSLPEFNRHIFQVVKTLSDTKSGILM